LPHAFFLGNGQDLVAQIPFAQSSTAPPAEAGRSSSAATAPPAIASAAPRTSALPEAFGGPTSP
jgi:hypothetical protein